MSDSNKYDAYRKAKETEKKGKKSQKKTGKGVSKNDKIKLIVLASVIVLLIIGILLLIIKVSGWQPFKEAERSSGEIDISSEEWTDIELQTPEDAGDGRTQKEGVYTFICCGTDEGEYRADTIMLVYLDTNQKIANVLHIPRDTFVSSNGRDYKINSFYARKKSDGIRQIVYNKLGIYANYYATVNFESFKTIVDIIGGVEVDVPFDMKYDDPVQNLHINLKAGLQILDGDKAEQYVRYRKGSGGDGSDVSRQERQ